MSETQNDKRVNGIWWWLKGIWVEFFICELYSMMAITALVHGIIERNRGFQIKVPTCRVNSMNR